MIEIKIPPLGESVSEAVIAKWNKKSGDFVKKDELLLELETDKVTLEINAASDGVLSEIKFNQSSIVKVGDIVGLIDEKQTQGVSNNSPVSPAPQSIAAKVEETIAAPSAKKIASENNVNLSAIDGSGKDGRVTKGDVLNAINTPPVTSPKGAKPVEVVKMSRLRKRIAERLKESQNTAAILTTFNEIDMSNVIEIRKKYREDFEKVYNVKLGFMSFFVKAVVKALQDIPSVNASIEQDDILYKNYYDIGIAVGTEQGLVVPVLRDADKLSFAGIEKEIGNLGKKAKDGKLSMEDLQGGTFSITNGGIYGSLLSTPIINPPQSGILGMHSMQERAVVINGKIEIRTMMYVALSYDHRLIDGKEAVTFLVKVKQAIENPEKLLLGL